MLWRKLEISRIDSIDIAKWNKCVFVVEAVAKLS